MLYKVFDFADKEAADVMVPRPEVVALSIDLPPEECLAAVIDSPYTRYPVYRESLDDIVGILHVRDLFSAMNEVGIARVVIEDVVRPAHIVPETKDLAALLAEFRRLNQHMAIVVDEYGAMEGIVTLEDILEEIVGEIEDEFDLPDESIEQVDETTIRIDGTFPIDDFNEQFDRDAPGRGLPHGRRASSSACSATSRRRATRSCTTACCFRVVEVEGSRIERLEVEFLPRPARRAKASRAAEAWTRPDGRARSVELRGVDDLEVEPGDAAQRVQVVVRPARVGSAADVPVRAVVGDDHPVALERGEHDPRLAREARDREARLQAHAQAHRRQVGVGEVARVVPRRVDVGAARALDGEAQRVVDHAARDLVVAGEAGQDRQARGVGRRPARGPHPVRAAGSRSRPSRRSSRCAPWRRAYSS